jgi:hypothetical protein
LVRAAIVNGGKKRAVANYFNRLENVVKEKYEKKSPLPRLKVAYGSARFAPGGYGRMSTPTTSVFRACQHRFPTAVVDEFRSTIMHSAGRGALKLVYSQAMRKTVRGLLWWNHTSPLGKHFVNRDFNAAKNISRCFTTRVRPVELTRNSSPAISKEIGVRIRV